MSDNTQLDTHTSVALSFMIEDTKDQDVSPFLLADDNDKPVQLSKLTESERQRLDICKRKIQECLDDGFFALGCSLFEIKKDKLYRETHTTFAAFCQDEFKISRVHGDRLVNAYRVQEILKSEPTGSVSIPKTESGMRALNGSSREEVLAVGKQLKQDRCDNPTATDIFPDHC